MYIWCRELFAEKAEGLKDGEAYNTCPVFGPDGTLLCRYRKKVPFRPGDVGAQQQKRRTTVFLKFREKGITVGLQICYDQFFSRDFRTLALKGAELILSVRLWARSNTAMCLRLYREPGRWRNELFYIWTCGTGQLGASTCCGNSIIADPEGQIVLQCPRPRHWSQRRWIFPV